MNKKAAQNSFRNIVRKIHLVLGFSTGIVVFIVAMTGCCWVFQEEIQSWSRDYRQVSEENKPLISPSEAKQIAEKVYPGRSIHGVLYGNRREAVEVIFYQENPKFYRAVFLNPYNGEIIKTEDYLSGFFAFVLDGHLNLWLPESIGSKIVSWSTLIFVIILLTGIVLWWPRNKQGRKQRFRFDWKSTTQWKRKNYDLHTVIGFYASFIAVIIAFTGLVMAFDWFGKAAYQAFGGDKPLTFTIPDHKPLYVPDTTDTPPIDRLLPILKTEFPQARQFEIHYPYTDSASIYVEISYEEGIHYSSDYRYYDQYTLMELEATSLYGIYENTDLADKMILMNYDTHIGAILGLPGKILVFFISLQIASLPVTGFMIWWGRKNKARKSKKTRKAPAVQLNLESAKERTSWVTSSKAD